jgi:predicted ATP-grasp superfamily ATP-dependent carboligase
MSPATDILAQEQRVSTRTDPLAVAQPDRSASRANGRPRVLITEGDNVGVLAMARGLKRAGYDPWIAVVHRNAPAARSRSVAGVGLVPDPSVSGSAFVQRIAELARFIDPVAIVPGGEKGMLSLAAVRDQRSPISATLAVCDRDTVYRATDKRRLIELAADVGLKAPLTVELSADEAACKPLPLALPAIVKPIRSEVPSNGGFRACGVHLTTTREQVVASLRRFPGERGLLQSFHRGALSSLAGVFWQGELMAAVYQQAVRTWPTGCGQMAFAKTLPRDPALELQIGRLLAALGWTGLFQLQFLETEEGPLMIDLNPRVYGSLSLAQAAGQNLPAIWIDLLIGGAVTPAPYVPGVSFRNEVLDACALLAAARGTRWGPLARQAAIHATTYAFFEAGDPMPLLALGPTLASKLGTRAWHRASVHSQRRNLKGGVVAADHDPDV